MSLFQFVFHICLSLFVISYNFKIIQTENKLRALGEPVEDQSHIIIILMLVILANELYNAYTFLKKKIYEFDRDSRNVIWMFGKFILLIINLALSFTFLYWIITLNFPDSIKNPDSLGNDFWSQGGNLLYYSFGNYLGFDTEIIPKGFLFKTLHVVQATTSFLVIVFIIGNFDKIRQVFLKN